MERLSVFNLITFRDWLQQKVAVHEQLLMSYTSNNAQMEENDQFRKNQVLASNVAKTSNSKVSSNVRKEQCPLCDESQRIGKCSLFLSRSVKQRSAFVSEINFDYLPLVCSHGPRLFTYVEMSKS